MMAGTETAGRLFCGRALWTTLLALALCGFGMGRAQTVAPDRALIEKGRYVAVAGDCLACHTKPGSKAFAGGYEIPSPMGPIVSSNITPSKAGGIGDYTEAQFARALREGIRADGAHLYPAMPYTSYSGMTDTDVHALYTYFMNAVAPVDVAPAPTKLAFPFNIRLMMIAWNTLFLDDRRFVPDSTKSPEWNRGAYLAVVLEHCSVCHTPRNAMLAEIGSRAFAGAPLGSWYAPNITSDPVSGTGGWSDAELIQYLKSGDANGKGQAAGGMAEAVQNSLQFLTPADLSAIAVYVKSIPPIRDPAETQPAYAHGSSANFEPALRGKAKQTNGSQIVGGEALFSGYCASCHQPTGAGTSSQSYPALFHNTATGGIVANNMISAVLFGVDRKAGDEHVFMPRFDELSFVQPLSDDQVSQIVGYVARQFGNPRLQVTAADVAMIRVGGPRPPLALISAYAAPALIAVAVIVIGLVALLLIRRRRWTRWQGSF